MAQSRYGKASMEAFRLAAERPPLFARGEPLFWDAGRRPGNRGGIR
ncbi:MAG: hypothetical protein Q8P50_06465 [Bacillota bacterium]|nr:hypothetical protein [Bacillota bacterium]